MCAFRVDRSPSCSETRLDGLLASRPWYAIFTHPRHEKRVAEQLRIREVEAYLPTYTCKHVWKNRQTVQLELPLFPGYIFARLGPTERKRALAAPGVVTIVEGLRESGNVPEQYIQFLRKGLELGIIRPHAEPLVGDRVRILTEPFAGIEGVLTSERSELRVVVAIECIGQSVSIETSRLEIALVTRPRASARSVYQ
jgi:transcription antitermination factor NusG